MRLARLLPVACVALALGACGDSVEESGSGLEQLTVIETVGVSSAFVHYGIERGMFRRHGLDVRVKESQGGAASIPAVVAGDAAIGGSNAASVLLAAAKGVPLRIVASGTSATKNPRRDYSSLIVPGGSRIRSVAGLEGKTVAVNNIDNINELTVKAIAERAGADPERIRFLEVDFPEMGVALRRGGVDAAAIIEPFQTEALRSGARIIARPFVAVRPGLQVGTWLTTEGYVREHRDTVARFRRGVADTGRLVARDAAAFRRYLPRAAGVEPDLARHLVLPRWTGEVDRGSLEVLAGLLVKYGVAEKRADVDEVLAESAAGE